MVLRVQIWFDCAATCWQLLYRNERIVVLHAGDELKKVVALEPGAACVDTVIEKLNCRMINTLLPHIFILFLFFTKEYSCLYCAIQYN